MHPAGLSSLTGRFSRLIIGSYFVRDSAEIADNDTETRFTASSRVSFPFTPSSATLEPPSQPPRPSDHHSIIHSSHRDTSTHFFALASVDASVDDPTSDQSHETRFSTPSRLSFFFFFSFFSAVLFPPLPLPLYSHFTWLVIVSCLEVRSDSRYKHSTAQHRIGSDRMEWN